MRRVLPHPVLAVCLLVLWLVLQQSLWIGHVLVGAVVAVVASWAANAVVPERVTFKRPMAFFRLMLVAGADIVRSNLHVMAVLLNPRSVPNGRFVEMELELTNTFGLAVLACLMTATPGSAWLQHDRERSTVLVHVFDLDDADAWAADIKRRYETLLLEIFE